MEALAAASVAGRPDSPITPSNSHSLLAFEPVTINGQRHYARAWMSVTDKCSHTILCIWCPTWKPEALRLIVQGRRARGTISRGFPWGEPSMIVNVPDGTRARELQLKFHDFQSATPASVVAPRELALAGAPA